MTAITRNLPWFIKDLGVSIIGGECYTSLVEDLHITDTKCLKYAISKGLGIGIVVGGSIMRLPQLFLILNARSARGLSLSSFSLETLAYSINTTYSYRNGFPFSTYGENFFLSLQNAIIVLLIIHYRPSLSYDYSKRRQHLLTALLSLLLMVSALSIIPHWMLAFLQAATLPLAVSAKLPQIMQNARAKSTGQLSAFAVGAQIVGCLARLYTTAMEVGDWLVASAFGMALVLNGILGVQLWIYWGKGGIYDAEDYELAEGGGVDRKEKVSVYLGGLGKANTAANGAGVRSKTPPGPTRIRLGTPPQRARKVD
ncbi:mannose-P-dolichol utilization defect 1 protein [Macrolepiota fuliginosa MF-IS2]|uniref:Mannose-P-dolichol utilization defect 1 protein n=1 Tax=Macrolepiota fuliginosa MF-IS2 TaxID=1400762 RepID=A0A9P5XEZ0_9AGAR|nr:mannose-P-dolichol utilization defect 1 protein [Macrolepiota fuliginosa MF-IS2]